MTHAQQDPWLRLWADRCQCVAGRVSDADPLVLLSELRQLFADLPNAIEVVDQFLLRSLLGQAVSRILRAHKVDQDPGIARAFLAFASSGLTAGHWQREFNHLLDRCLTVFGAATMGRLAHLQVERALGVIDARCDDPSLNLEAVANDIRLSASHVSRF